MVAGTDPADVLTIMSPEGDLRVAFVVVPLEGTREEMAGRAWRAFDSSFDFPVLQKLPMPGLLDVQGRMASATGGPSLNSRLHNSSS